MWAFIRDTIEVSRDIIELITVPFKLGFIAMKKMSFKSLVLKQAAAKICRSDSKIAVMKPKYKMNVESSKR